MRGKEGRMISKETCREGMKEKRKKKEDREREWEWIE